MTPPAPARRGRVSTRAATPGVLLRLGGARDIALRCRRDLTLRGPRRRGGLGAGLRRRRTADGEIGLELLEALGADALHVLEVLYRLERAVRLAVVDDRL